MINNMEVEEYIFNSSDYIHAMIEYSGIFNNETKNKPNVYITILNEEYAILSIKSNLVNVEGGIRGLDNIGYIKSLINQYYIDNSQFKLIYIFPTQIYTLQEISAIDATQVNMIQGSDNLKLTGEGVIVGIIDTGIDYLSDEFMDRNGKSRILAIWDQTSSSQPSTTGNVPFGTLYTNEAINRAIDTKLAGGNPYDIIPCKDEIGHGTAMAGIVGAAGKNKDIRGIAPDCQFVVVKLSEANYLKKKLNINTPVFGVASVFAAIEYLKRILLETKKPVVILLPLGSNNGNHKGDNPFDSFIENVSRNIGIIIVTGSGNEANQDGHASGIISEIGDIENLELIIDRNQNYMIAEIWVDLPNIIDINLISPAGEETGFISASSNSVKDNTFVIEGTKTVIRYFFPEEFTGEELVSIYFDRVTHGIWQIKLRLSRGKMAKYNAWILQKGLAYPETKFSPSDPYGTVTIPGDSDFVITVAGYDQNNNNLLIDSGISFREEYIDKIDFSAGGAETMTVGLNNSTQIIKGTSLSAAIGAGACVLLFQWGIVQKNYPYMYSQSIKTFLRRGVVRRGKDTYPNSEWGYGIINFYKIFESMM